MLTSNPQFLIAHPGYLFKTETYSLILHQHQNKMQWKVQIIATKFEFSKWSLSLPLLSLIITNLSEMEKMCLSLFVPSIALFKKESYLPFESWLQDTVVRHWLVLGHRDTVLGHRDTVLGHRDTVLGHRDRGGGGVAAFVLRSLHTPGTAA